MSFTRGNDLALAIRLADAADSITLARYQAIDLQVVTKPDNTPVTDADKASEEAIRALLKSHRPDDGIVGEEFGNDGADAERYWVIDPIDGTKNFLRGVPTWATLIGLIEKRSDGSEVVVVGVVSAPALFRRWYASEGNGAYVMVNKSAPKKIAVSQVSQIKMLQSHTLISRAGESGLLHFKSYSDKPGALAVSVIFGHICWWPKALLMSQQNLYLKFGIWQRST